MSAKTTSPSDPSPVESLAYARQCAHQLVFAGFAEPATIIEAVAGMTDLDEAQVGAIVDEEMAAHRTDQVSWPEITDCDRLDAAFSTLEDRGILARQDYTCCQRCGSAAIFRELAEQRAGGWDPRGFVFFHNQDTALALEGTLLLAFGADRDEDAVAIGHEIVAALRGQSLDVDWDGDVSQRISVRLLWQRRREHPLIH